MTVFCWMRPAEDDATREHVVLQGFAALQLEVGDEAFVRLQGSRGRIGHLYMPQSGPASLSMICRVAYLAQLTGLMNTALCILSQCLGAQVATNVCLLLNHRAIKHRRHFNDGSSRIAVLTYSICSITPLSSSGRSLNFVEPMMFAFCPFLLAEVCERSVSLFRNSPT